MYTMSDVCKLAEQGPGRKGGHCLSFSYLFLLVPLSEARQLLTSRERMWRARDLSINLYPRNTHATSLPK